MRSKMRRRFFICVLWTHCCGKGRTMPRLVILQVRARYEDARDSCLALGGTE